MTDLIMWGHNPASSFLAYLPEDEIKLLDEDMQEAIDGVIQEWRNK